MAEVIIETLFESWWLLDVLNVTTPYNWMNEILKDGNNYFNTIFWIMIVLIFIVKAIITENIKEE